MGDNGRMMKIRFYHEDSNITLEVEAPTLIRVLAAVEEKMGFREGRGFGEDPIFQGDFMQAAEALAEVGGRYSRYDFETCESNFELLREADEKRASKEA